MNKRIDLLKTYLAEDPADPFMRYALALEYVQLKMPEEAIRLFAGLVKSNPDYLPTYYHFGKSLEQNLDEEAAARIYSAGMELAKTRKEQRTYNELLAALNELRGEADESE